MIKLHNDSPSHLAYKAYCSGLDSQRDYNSENIKRNDATVRRLPFQQYVSSKSARDPYHIYSITQRLFFIRLTVFSFFHLTLQYNSRLVSQPLQTARALVPFT